MKLRLLSVIAISLALAACVTTGGGYGPDSKRPIRIDDKPYLGEFPKNSAGIKFDPRVMEQSMMSDLLAWATGDFHGDGTTSILTGTQRYAQEFANATIKENPHKFNGLFQLFHVDKKTGKQELTWSMVGCLHPRHIAAADFNQDGRLDAVVGCQGHQWEFPPADEVNPQKGEYSVMLINDGKGGFTASKFGTSTSFYHGITAGDVNDRAIAFSCAD